MANIEELFGSSVFNDAVMQKRLPKDIYKALHKTITDGTPLDPQVANVVANAMKDWAVERGVTHYTHWFQPLTGITAEKHDSFRPRTAARLSSNSAARNSSAASRTLPRSLPAACAPRLRPAAIRRGIPPATPLSRTACCASRRRSVPTAAKRSTRRRRCFARWRHCPRRRFAC